VLVVSVLLGWGTKSERDEGGEPNKSEAMTGEGWRGEARRRLGRWQGRVEGEIGKVRVREGAAVPVPESRPSACTHLKLPSPGLSPGPSTKARLMS